MILVSRNIRCSLCGYSLGFLGEGASNDSGVVGGYFIGNFGEKASIVCSLQTKSKKKAVLWQENRTMPL